VISVGAKKKKKVTAEEEALLHNPFIFGIYDISDVEVQDPGLARYINLTAISVPHTSAQHANRKFAKAKVSVVERLINGMMRTEEYTGKKSKSYRVVRDAFEIISSRTKANPIQVLVYAIQRSSPKEETTRLKFGGISVPKAVDISPSRRLDTALRNICKGAVKGSHKNKRPVSECLAMEIVKASKGEMDSFAVSKKEELERVAKSAR